MPPKTFTTVDDVVAHLIELEPAFAEELTHEQLQDIVRRNSDRYEDITAEQIDAMYTEAMAACA